MIHTQTATLVIQNKWMIVIVYVKACASSYEAPSIAEGPSLELAKAKLKLKEFQIRDNS